MGDGEGSNPLLGLPGLRGRGAGINPGNRFESVTLHVLGEHLDHARAECEAEGGDPDAPGRVPTTLLDDQTRTVINPVDLPDVPMKWTVNPYRGCEHGCIYCYARPGHEYLGMSCGVDFETKIMVKRDAAMLLRAELSRPSWSKGGVELISFSGVTDCYQPVERKLGITRACLEVCLEFRQPVGLITKNRLITRDLDLLGQFAAWRGVHAAISLTTLDPLLASRLEPRASSPRDRLEAISQLAAADVPVCVMTAPIIPGLNDREIPALLEAAKNAGATNAGYIMMRLPWQIKDLFLDWLRRHYPERAGRVESLIRDVRDGQLSDPRFGSRMRGSGPMAETIRDTFALFRSRFGLDRSAPRLNCGEFKVPARPDPSGQAMLFGGE